MQYLQTLGFTRGVNLGGWMSQCDYSEDRLEHFITEADIAKIASWGLDHVRIPVDYNGFEDELLREQGFGYPVNAGNRDAFHFV